MLWEQLSCLLIALCTHVSLPRVQEELGHKHYSWNMLELPGCTFTTSGECWKRPDALGGGLDYTLMLAWNFIEIAFDMMDFQLQGAQNDELRSRMLSSNVVKQCANALSSGNHVVLPVHLINIFMKYDDGCKAIFSSGIFDTVVNHIFIYGNTVRYTLHELSFWVSVLVDMLQYGVVRAQMKTFDFKSFFKSVLSLRTDRDDDYRRVIIIDQLSQFESVEIQFSLLGIQQCLFSAIVRLLVAISMAGSVSPCSPYGTFTLHIAPYNQISLSHTAALALVIKNCTDPLSSLTTMPGLQPASWTVSQTSLQPFVPPPPPCHP
ncbi:hypothetical protein BU17DRAFT_67188 [Hysterangium stoloniferum]|nr:hypothetical protein BU17DRAFT_67188 [Hysterangium stoloniferum]